MTILWFQIPDPITPPIKKEVLEQNASPPEGTKSNNVDTMYMKVTFLLT
jgi:hypothetical protein